MRSKFAFLLEKLTAIFWIIPTLMTIGLFFVLYFTSGIFVDDSHYLGRLLFHAASAEGARSILSAISASLITVVGVLFSILVVVLQQVSTQYSPRVIHNFIRSHTTKVVMGLYIGTFVYCILLLRQIPVKENFENFPNLSLFIAIVLSVCCVGSLIYFINHILFAIQSINIINDISTETIKTVHNLVLSYDNEHPKAYKSSDENFLNDKHQVVLTNNRGYLQNIDIKSINELIKKDDLDKICIPVRVGEYIQKGEPILEYLGSLKYKTELSRAFTFGNERTLAQDPSFGIQQLVDIALKALSPGINDPSTAVEALNHINAIIWELVKADGRAEITCQKCDRIIYMKNKTVEDYLTLAYGSIPVFAQEYPFIINKIKMTLADIPKHEGMSDDWVQQSKQFLAVHHKLFSNS